MGQVLRRGSLIDRELGHYRIVEKIGEGGMGEVFLARDEHLGREVALKVLPPGTDDRSRQLLRKEAHALSGLNHPNIVTVLDFDTQDNLDFLVMEYVPGQALDEKIRPGSLREKEIVRLGLQLAEGLAAAHAQGIIHRDLKPGNLRLTRDGRLKILDFGLAWTLAPLGALTSTVSAVGSLDCSGTLPYMASEQLLGLAVDERTDIYAAGAVLYELYTGHGPFEQKLFPALVDDILHKAPTSPGQVRPGISPRFESVILKCLEKDPDKRYPSAADLVRELRQLADPVGTPTRSPRRRRVLFGLYGLAAIVVLLVLLFALNWHATSWITASNPVTPRIDSLAVLPFLNLSGDPQQGHRFSDHRPRSDASTAAHHFPHLSHALQNRARALARPGAPAQCGRRHRRIGSAIGQNHRSRRPPGQCRR
jgi:serine/threonine protein kinase